MALGHRDVQRARRVPRPVLHGDRQHPAAAGHHGLLRRLPPLPWPQGRLAPVGHRCGPLGAAVHLAHLWPPQLPPAARELHRADDLHPCRQPALSAAPWRQTLSGAAGGGGAGAAHRGAGRTALHHLGWPCRQRPDGAFALPNPVHRRLCADRADAVHWCRADGHRPPDHRAESPGHARRPDPHAQPPRPARALRGRTGAASAPAGARPS